MEPTISSPRGDELKDFTADTAARLHAAVGVDAVVDADPQAFVAAARSALDLGRHEDARALARAALALAPTSAPGWTILGDAWWLEGNAALARDAWSEALSHDDRDLGTAVSCARAHLACGAPDEARALLTFVLTRAHSGALRETALAVLADVDAGASR